jgi:molybdate transport system ATP-binding protein
VPRPLVSLDRVDAVLGGVTVLREVSFTLGAGEGVAVLGENGSGKSTFLRLLRGDLWPAPGSAGRRLFHADDGPSASPVGVRERLALVAPEAQDAYVRRDWELPVEVAIRAGFFDALWPSEAATPAQAARVREVAATLGIAHLLARSTLELSRGEGRRVLLARALVSRPSALLLDEACDGLDAGARQGFLALVAQALRGGTAVVMATHRPEELLPEMRVLRVEGGRLVPADTAADSVTAAATDTATDSATATATASVSLPPASAPPRRWPRTLDAAPVVFQLSSATVVVEGRAVLSDLDWVVRAGERWSVVGQNGAGKSTLLRLLAGEEQPAHGRVDRLGLGPGAGADDLRGRIGVVSPELQARHRHDARGEDVVLSGFSGSVGLAVAPAPVQVARARAAAERLRITGLLGRRIHSLSYGELRKLLLARALAPGPEVLLLDEPLAGLDPGARAWVQDLLEELSRQGPAIVAVSHHLDELPRGGISVRLVGGRLVREG